MSGQSPPFASPEHAKSLYAGQDAEPLRLSVVMTAAAGMVARLAPAPDPVADEYAELARSAELMAGEYLWETRGYVSSENISGISVNYGSLPSLESAVTSLMGPYAASAGAFGPSTRTLRSVSLERA